MKKVVAFVVLFTPFLLGGPQQFNSPRHFDRTYRIMRDLDRAELLLNNHIVDKAVFIHHIEQQQEFGKEVMVLFGRHRHKIVCPSYEEKKKRAHLRRRRSR